MFFVDVEDLVDAVHPSVAGLHVVTAVNLDNQRY